ncbi:MAG: dihydrolipoamide acetyltransferase family protein, partial [Actinomycetota bacterium]
VEPPPPPEPAPAPEPPSSPGQPAPPPAPEAPLQAAPPSARPVLEGTRKILSPLVRRLAAEKKVDLETVTPTGFGGRVTREDVLSAAENLPAPTGTAGKTTRPRPAGGTDEVVPISTIRKFIADHMVASHIETARAWNTIEVDMTAVGRIRKQAGPAFKATEGHSLTWMPFVCKAVCSALFEYPQINSTWNGDGTITLKHYVNLGIAVALENGLIVPVIKGADQMNILGLSRAIRDVADRARSKRLSPDEVAGGTFTITNPGSFGSLMSVPIINKGQAGILSFDAIAKRPVVVTDEYGQDSIAIRERVFISLSWDHRIIDGAEAAQFLNALRLILEEADFHGDLDAFLK